MDKVDAESGTMRQTQTRKRHREGKMSDLSERPVSFVDIGLLDHVRRLGEKLRRKCSNKGGNYMTENRAEILVKARREFVENKFTQLETMEEEIKNE